MRTTYKNWLYIIWLPLVVYLAIEWLLGWPLNEVLPQYKKGYYSASITVIGILLFAAFGAVAVNYRHFKKLVVHQRPRRTHMVISIIFLVLIYGVGKLLILGSSFTRDQFIAKTGTPVQFALLQQVLPLLLVMYFLFQVFFALQMKKTLAAEGTAAARKDLR